MEQSEGSLMINDGTLIEQDESADTELRIGITEDDNVYICLNIYIGEAVGAIYLNPDEAKNLGVQLIESSASGTILQCIIDKELTHEEKIEAGVVFMETIGLGDVH